MRILLLALLLTGCVSMPTIPAGSFPSVQGYGVLPNCVAWCHVIVTVEKADSKIDSSGGGAVTGGAQSLSASSTQTTSQSDANTRTVEPKP